MRNRREEDPGYEGIRGLCFSQRVWYTENRKNLERTVCRVTIIYSKIIISALLGLTAGLSVVYIFNRMPAGWLCDYGEEPSEELRDPQIQRVKGWPWRWVYAGLFACIALRMAFTEIRHPAAGLAGLPETAVQLISQGQLMLAALLACWAMVIIGLADLKYMIIPDQFVIILAVSALGFLPLQGGMRQAGGSPVWGIVMLLGGALLGGGAMLAVALLGRLAFRRDVMGFGDVKLCTALGLGLGITGTAFVLAAASVLSGIAAAVGLAKKKYTRYDMKPLGPYLCGCAVFYIFIVLPFMI